MLSLKGKFHVKHVRNGKVIAEFDVKNGIVDVGLNDLLDKYFHNGTPPTTWYIGLISNTGPPSLAAGDTMSSHSGWTESTVYSNGTRPAWGNGAASARATTNSSPAVFNINGSDTLYGLFAVSNSTKGGTSGTLWATAAFSATQPVINGDTFNVTYTVSG